MAAGTLRREEGLGLGLAVAAHAGLLAFLLLRPESAEVVKPPERIEVTITDEAALTSTAPEPSAQAPAAIAPTLGEPAPMAVPERAEPEPLPPQPVVRPQPAPRESEVDERPRRRPEAARNDPPPRPVARPTPPKPKPAPPRTATAKAAPRAQPKGVPPKAAPKAANRPAPKAGGSRLGNDFLEGVSGGQATKAAGTPAAAIGPQVRSSLAGAISRQLKPRWQAPQGPEAEELVTILSFSLNRDGSLAGAPTVVRQLGINDVNRAQADRHAEQAKRAVQLAAPFDLPSEYYEAWKRVSSFRFDKRLSQ